MTACSVNEYLLNSGQGSGAGVEHTVVSELVTQVLQDSTIWKKVHDNYVLSLPPAGFIQSPPERLNAIKTAGYVCMLHVLWTNAAPANISPAFLLAVICGEASIVDLDFLSQIDPQIAATLRPWPLDHSLPINVHDVAIRTLICDYINRQVGLSVTYRTTCSVANFRCNSPLK